MSSARIPSSPEGPAHFRDPAWAGVETALPSSDSPVARQLPPMPQSESDSSNIWLVIRAESWQQLKLVALAVLGPASHELGLCYGLAEGGWGIISGLLDLLKMVVLEGLYEEAHQAWSWNPFEWPDYLEGRTADYFLHAHLEAAHRQFTGLMQQLALAIKDPGTFFGAVWDSEVESYAAKWQRYKWLIGHRTLTNEFEAGRLEGGVLLEVILLLATVVDGAGLAIKGAKALGEIPELVRLAKTVRSAEEAKAALAARRLENLRSGTQALRDADGATADSSRAVPPAATAEKVAQAASGKIDYGSLDQLGRPTGVKATITKDMIGTGTPASSSIRPPDFDQLPVQNRARGHLLARQLGGSGSDPRNLVTMEQTPANSPVMRDFENQVRAAVEDGQTVDYSATPIYDGDNPIPQGITLQGKGSGGFNLNTTVLNPPGR
jgi:hypothetical protein